MNCEIDWTFFFEVGSPEKARRLFKRVADALEFQLNEVSTERYWKLKSLYKVHAKSHFAVGDVKDMNYVVMRNLGRLSRAWIVSSPVEDGGWQFGGATQTGSVEIPGVDSISFAAVASQMDLPRQIAKRTSS